LVVLNDNGQVSLPTGQPSAGGIAPAGALSGYTSRLLTSSTFKTVRDIAKGREQLLLKPILQPIIMILFYINRIEFFYA
jgi:1-deoxy-D-xylulose-5-phosphate synthase